jgi:hypothetical protein
MPAPEGAPDWAAELYISFESGASGQFILYGNVHDRLAVGGRLVSIERYIEDELLASFHVIFSYDLGNGLTVERGGERLAEWVPTVMQSLPRDPLAAIRFVSRFGRYLGNLRAIGKPSDVQVAVIIRGADQLLPADGSGFEHGSLTSLVREWGSGTPFTDLAFASLLIADNLNDLEPLVAFGPQSTLVRIPLPSVSELQSALRLLQREFTKTIPATTNLPALAAAMTGVSVSTLEQLTKVRAHRKQILQSSDFAVLKKDMVEHDAPGLVEFVESKRTLDDYYGQDALKEWFRQDVMLWRTNDLRALPMGYLLCGPIGTGKTFLVECLAGEAGVPVVKLKNFREKWVGSSEGNLEKIFRLVRALARRYDLAISPDELQQMEPQLPLMLTPGAAEALVVKAYRVARTQDVAGGAALAGCLGAYQNPVPEDVLEKQMRLAVREATDLSFVPESLRHLAASVKPDPA